MELISVNLGQERILPRKDRIERTGIFKYPAQDAVRVTKLGMAGDVIASKKHHGGADQAVYVYGGRDYEWWERELGRRLAPGTFGENLTIRDLESASFNVGDYLHSRDITLQVTAARIPCSTFARRMDDPQWVKRFRQAERPGLYCRVLKEGLVKAGQVVNVEPYTGETISILEMFREYYNRNKREEILRRHLAAPIAIRARRDLEKQLHFLLHRQEI
ncbi:MAG TPA: MOSC domain-containing protein [Anaerolineales bacterium]|nr:MOSC domain-containing protein [Anaerolineales bacterium]